MRLIDADALLKKFRYGEADTDNDKAWISTIRRMIKEQPTIYDVEKVVEQLEERRSEYEVYSENAPDEELRAYRKGVMRGCEYSQDIVKRGGVE